jgi:hypothetical protein
MLPEDSPQKCLYLERRVYQAPEKNENFQNTIKKNKLWDEAKQSQRLPATMQFPGLNLC